MSAGVRSAGWPTDLSLKDIALKSIGLKTSEQFAVKYFVASLSPNFNDKCLLELKF